VAQLNVRLTDEQIRGLRQYAARRRTPVAWLVKDYIEYLLRGGEPVSRPATAPGSDAAEELSGEGLAALAERGGAFDWLLEEPDLYSATDGEPV
jgi:hypothetical protein